MKMFMQRANSPLRDEARTDRENGGGAIEIGARFRAVHYDYCGAGLLSDVLPLPLVPHPLENSYLWVEFQLIIITTTQLNNLALP